MSWTPTSQGRYDALPGEDRARFAGACSALERGEVAAAHEVLSELSRRHPDCIALGAWLQEAEIALAPPAERAAATARLAARYRESAADAPSPAALLLAARLESDPARARELCERAIGLDPACAWAHYAEAFLAMRAKSWHAARESIARALDADPGHVRTRRLQAEMLARGGNLDEAIAAYEAWIDHAEEDPTVERHLVREAELDLALLEVLAGEPDRARKRIEELGAAGFESGRRLAALAACEQALGEWREALSAARQAEGLGSGDPLPIVQQALLLEYWLEDPAGAVEAWERVLEAAGDEASLAALLQRTRARVRIERASQPRP
jgi:Tfp pilus assembly protein PilF